MKIVLFHPAQLPPKDYGGVERVVLWLAKGLVRLGHEVFVAALSGSRLPEGARLIEISPGRVSAHDLIPKLPKGVDVVHFMAPPEKAALEGMDCASLLTVHGNGEPGEEYPRNSVFLSANHAERHQAKTFVYNGIDPEEYEFLPEQKENFFFFLSKTNWRVKNLSGAIRYCRRAGVPLKIAGGHRPFRTRILLPFLGRNLDWVGPVSGPEKASLLARARALVFPVIWPEPFGLVIAEALMSGTPVLGSKKGSLPELIDSEVGAVFENEDAWVEFLNRGVVEWKPEVCREYACRHFHYEKMAKSYEKLYERVASGAFLQDKQPVAGNWRKELYDSAV